MRRWALYLKDQSMVEYQDIAQSVVEGIHLLRERGMGDRAIARATGVSHVTILKWASGETSPTARNAQKFLDRLSRLVGAQDMADILVQRIGTSVNVEDVDKYAEILFKALWVLRRDDQRSHKLIHEIDFLCDETGDTPLKAASERPFSSTIAWKGLKGRRTAETRRRTEE